MHVKWRIEGEDGAATILEEQAQGPPLNSIEMGMPNGEAVAERLFCLLCVFQHFLLRIGQSRAARYTWSRAKK